MNVIKRDGSKVEFNKEKIINAINAAFLEVDGILYETDTANDIADEIEKHIKSFYDRNLNLTYPINLNEAMKEMTRQYSVEEIQNLIEEYLMRSERPDVARAYIRFRYKREVVREHKADFMKAYSEKLEARNVKNQNANVDEHSFGGRMGEANGLMIKQYALDFCVSSMAKKNHLENMVYIHDLDSYAVGMHNCLSVPFDHLLAEGFNTRQTDVRPAGSVNTAMQLVAVIFQLQSLQQFGGVSATHLDWTMVPYVKKSFYKHLMDGFKYLEGVENPKTIPYQENSDVFWTQYCGIEDKDLKDCHFVAWNYAMDMTEKETRQAVEGLYHNLNTLQSRSGNQLPFTSINYGTCTSPEGRMVTKALLEVLLDGLGSKRKTSIFPCGIFQMKSGINRKPGEPNYDLYQLALRCTATRLYPNYANCDWSGNAGYNPDDPTTYFSTMGCRTANGWDVNGLGQ